MKPILSVQKIFLFTALFATSYQSFSQCKGYAKRADFSALDAFDFCENVRVAKMYSGDEAKINQKMTLGKRYRIVVDNQKFIGDVALSIRDEQEKIIGKEVKTETENYWEVMVDKNQTIHIYLKVPKEQSTVGILSSGCVALAIGELENETLVVYP